MLPMDPNKTPGIGYKIVGVRILGNEKTSRGTLLTHARVPLGHPFTLEVRDRIRRRLLSSGFVSKAVINWEVAKDKKESVILFITIKEKFSWFIAPMFSYSEGEYGGSLAFGDKNLAGLGKQMRFYAGYSNETQRLAMRYRDPNIALSPWYWTIFLSYTRSNLKEFDPSAEGIRRARLLRLQTFQRFNTGIELGYRWFNWVTTGVRYRFGLVDFENPHCRRARPAGETVFQRCPTRPDGLDAATLGRSWYVGPMAVPTGDGWTDSLSQREKFWNWKRDAAVVLTADISRMHNIHGMLHGFRVDGAVTIANRNLGGSFDYVTWNVAYHHSLSFLRNPEFGARMMLEWFASHSQTHGAPFNRELRAGGTDVRGYVSQQFVGDTLSRTRVQYKVHMFRLGWFMFRAVAFWDMAWIYFRDGGSGQAVFRAHAGHRRYYLPGAPSATDARSFHNGIGAGLRVYVKGLAIGTIGVDIAYGFGTRKPRFVVMLGT
jgi:outer membrane protein assembly factor BamA